MNRQLRAARASAQVRVAAAHIRRRRGLEVAPGRCPPPGFPPLAASGRLLNASNPGNSGLLKFGWLKTLKKSLRSSIVTVLVRCEVLVSEKSKLV